MDDASDVPEIPAPALETAPSVEATAMIAVGWPEPAVRARPGVPDGGLSVVLADGQEWVLPDWIPSMSPLWDRLFDHNCLQAKYDAPDIQHAATRLLLAGYDLSIDEAVSLVVGVEPQTLVKAVEGALFGFAMEARPWSRWRTASFYAAGLDPDAIPVRYQREVLEILVKTGRTVSETDFVWAAMKLAKKQRRAQEEDMLR